MKDIRDQIIEKQDEMIIALSTESINKERFDLIVGLGKDISSLKSQLSEQKGEYYKKVYILSTEAVPNHNDINIICRGGKITSKFLETKDWYLQPIE